MPAAACMISGRVTSDGTPLPGVAVLVMVDGERRGQTATGADGRYVLRLAPDASYQLVSELAFFNRVTRDVTTTSGGSCDQTVDITLALLPRGSRASAATSEGPDDSAPGRARPLPPPSEDSVAGDPAVPRRGGVNAPGARGGAGEGAPPAAMRDAGAPRRDGRFPRGGSDASGGGPAARFEPLNVAADPAAAALVDSAAAAAADAGLQSLLPPGFSVQAAAADAVTINGSGDATQIDRRMMADRIEAIARGDFDPAAGGFAGPGRPGFGGPGAFDGGPGGPGGPGGFGPGGPGGRPGGFILAGRNANQNAYQGSAAYGFGGSLLDTAPYQLRPEVPTTQPQFAKNTFGLTFGGPFKIPGLYQNEARRSRFQVNYSGGRSNNVFNQYATVPTDAMRAGDFSTSTLALIDPATGQPFAGNRIPADRISAAAQALLGYVPRANLPGTAQNYQLTTLAHTNNDDVSLRFTHRLAGTQPLGPGRGGFRTRAAAAVPADRRGLAPTTNVTLNGQLRIRHSSTESPNVFSALNSEGSSTSVSLPLSINVFRGRTMQMFQFDLTHSASSATNGFAGITDAAGAAGVLYPDASSRDALNWGVPNLSFATLSGARLAAATSRSDNRVRIGYTWNRGFGRHQLRAGGDYRYDRVASVNNGDARGSFLFTGIYTAPGAEVSGDSGADFADFLLGLPQQASLQSGGTTRLRGKAFSSYIENNWRATGKVSLNLGLRYELALPYTEIDRQLANLDVTPGFTAAAPVLSGGVGAYTGRFPAALIDSDVNNLGPRLGVAYRVAPGTVLRGGYSVTYAQGSYASIGRQLASQPPFSSTQTVLGSPALPLSLETALLSSTAATTNNWGVDREYALGRIQTWTAAVSRDLVRNWTMQVTYTGTKGSNLDILRAPNRGPDGLRIPDVQAFIWESSGGRSLLNRGTVQLRRRQAAGFSANLQYTLAKSMDNASSLGAGATVVAQNDQDLEAEWARSNFDRRHQFSAQGSWELPFGANRRWLSNGGLLAALLDSWYLSANFTYSSGAPFTPRVSGAASDAARGTSGSLRADYTGAAIALESPTVNQFFNTGAFAVPAPGTFGNSPRNIITGPSQHQLNAAISRDLRLGGNRGMTFSVNAANLLNTVQWAAIDTNLNSATFGQVLAVRPMRTITANLRMRF